MFFSDLFINIAKIACDRQDSHVGSMPAGHNGPYIDPETPVRNTSHWLQTFIRAYQLSNDESFLKAAQKCSDYLIGPDAPRTKNVYHHRTKEGKDSCNGLIGPAWTIEALERAYVLFGDKKSFSIACEYFLAHPFSETTLLWRRVEPDGIVLAEDMTFNHQLWFCAAGAILARHGNRSIRDQVFAFLDNIDKRLGVAPSGRIEHPIWRRKEKIKREIKRFVRPEFVKDLLLKEVGYHSFNLYAFALLYQQIPEHLFWETKKWKKILNYQGHREYISMIDQSRYGFPYNPPGFELPFVNSVFDRSTDFPVSDKEWLEKQVNFLLDRKNWWFSCSNKDPETLTARLYECSRFPDELFSLNIDHE